MINIPRKIHYCWFGGNPLDDKAVRCIESWRKYFPDYEIIQWNESNFDINSSDFASKAYIDRKWAFVSDVARLQILYDHGGLYFDTDVEVISSYDDILSFDADGFMGFEKTNQVNSGLGFGSVKGSHFIKTLLSEYDKIDYDAHKDNLSSVACTVLTTNLLGQHGLAIANQIQIINNFVLFPCDYFSPIDYFTGELRLTENSHSIHWYNSSWQSSYEREEFKKRQKLYRFIGKNMTDILLGIFSCIKKEGICTYLWTRMLKYIRK